MTHNEVNKTLIEASRLVNMMDKEHAKDLLKVLMGTNTKNDNASFLHMDIRKTVKKLLSDLIKTKLADKYLTRKQMKQIFEIMGDYGFYPICKLCGKPIKICTKNHGNQSNTCFSWDHIKPKFFGGTGDLSNMQPTHKICNNKRGLKPLCNVHYKLEVNIDIFFETDSAINTQKSKRAVPGLRKQDSWCHKQTNQYQR